MFNIDTSQLKIAENHFRLLQEDLQKAQKDFVQETSEYAFMALRNNMPVKSGRTKARIKEEPIVKIGDSYRGKVHIPPNGSEQSRVPQWLHHGTGVWGPIGRPYHPIKGEFMTFKHNGKLFRLTEVRGQQRNLYWEKTTNSVEAFSALRAHTIFNNIITR